jgi:AraC-like DNA-binding protein
VWKNDYHDVLTPIVKNWADFIFKMMIIVLIHFYGFFISHFFYFSNLLNLVIESSFLVVFLIGYFKVIFSPVLFYGSSKIENMSNTSSVSKLYIKKIWLSELNKRIRSPRDLQIYNRIENKVFVYIEQIEEIALVNYSFRKLDYSINELSMELGLPKYYLEFIFKYYCKVSFNDYKKIVRIYDAVRLIDDGYLSSNTLDTLSRHVGFASYNPFLINFKEILGLSPFDYYKKRTIIRNKTIS